MKYQVHFMALGLDWSKNFSAALYGYKYVFTQHLYHGQDVTQTILFKQITVGFNSEFSFT